MNDIGGEDINVDIKRKYRYKWSTNIKMLEIDGLPFVLPNTKKEILIQVLENKLTPVRVQTAYQNLKALTLHPDWEKPFVRFITAILLNNVTCQLESLHLDDRCDAVCDWQLGSLYDYSDGDSNDNDDSKYCFTNNTTNNLWFPKNLKHLCLCTNSDDLSMIN